MASTGGPPDTTDETKQLGKQNKDTVLKNCASFTNCITKIYNNQVDNAKDLDVVMLMYDRLECTIEGSNNYS